MIRIELDDRAVRRALEDLARRVGDLTPAMHDIGQALVEGIRNNIRDGRDWEGRPFTPNSPVTLAKKRGTRPLVDKGNLAGSRIFHNAGRDYVEVGSSAVQSATLHFGAKRGAFGKTRRGAQIPWGDIPPRPFMPIKGQNELPQSAREVVLMTIADYLNDAGR